MNLFVVIGPSGVGKTVLLKCLLGLILPDQGVVMVDGENTTYIQGKKRQDFLKNLPLFSR